MSGLKVVQVCPLGNECEEIKNDEIHRCRWYVRVVGRDPQTGEERDNWDCAINMAPMLMVESIGVMRGVQSATDSLRNHNISGAHQVVAALARVTQPLETVEKLER